MTTKQAQTHDFHSTSRCPKCQGEFNLPSMQRVNSGYELVYQCQQCSASFALIPVTAMKLCELVPDTWPAAPQEA